MRATRPPRPYRAIYDAKGGSDLMMDYMAEGRHFALQHAFHVLRSDGAANGLLGLKKVVALPRGGEINLGAFRPVA